MLNYMTPEAEVLFLLICNTWWPKK